MTVKGAKRMAVKWPTLGEVEAFDVLTLLGCNQSLPAPNEGTDHYTVLARIVERLREQQRELGDRIPEPDHPGWPWPAT